MNDVNFYLDAAEKKMSEAVAYLDDSLAHIRAGKANVKILDSIRVEYYGSKVPIGNVANISTPDQRTIAIMPWEKNMFRVIEKAIIDSNVGIMPESNGEVIRLSIPPLTEDRRKQLVKDSKAEAEKARVSVRNARRDAIEEGFTGRRKRHVATPTPPQAQEPAPPAEEPRQDKEDLSRFMPQGNPE